MDGVGNGALDFIEKPFHAATLVGRIREAVARHRAAAAVPSPLLPHFPGRELLTPRELEVLELIAAGASSTEAAASTSARAPSKSTAPT